MIGLVHLIKRHYRIVLSSLALLYLFFTITTSYILYSVLLNNALTVANFGNIFFQKIAIDMENKVDISKDIFYDIEQKYRKNILHSTASIDKYIRTKYLEKYDVAKISENGIIIETTNEREKNLNLNQFPDAQKSLDEARETQKLLVDYPVMNSDLKTFYIYLLKYIPEKKLFLQLGSKMMFVSEMLKSLPANELKSNYNFDYSLFYVYLDKDFLSVKLYGDHKEINKETIKNLFNKSDKILIIKSFNDVQLFSTLSYNKNFSIVYILHIKPLSRFLIAEWIILNLILFILFFILYKKFIIVIRKNIEKPLKEIKQFVNDGRPYQYNGNIIELKDLSETYENHLEKIKARDFLKEVLKAQEQERERIARDVHDIVIQNLNYILIKLRQIGDSELSEILKNQIIELRKLVIDSNVLMLKDLGLRCFLENFINDCSFRNPHIKFYFKDNFKNFEIFNKDEQVHILRIVRELIINSIKHSKCKLVELRTDKKNGFLCIEVIDDGIGFDISSIDIQIHFGLISVKERVFIMRGNIDIKSNSSGTQVLIQIPIKN